MQPSAFEIVVMIHGKYYLAGTVRSLHEQTELFFHFPWGSRNRVRVHGLDGRPIEDGCLPDHISFHRDGRVHTKTRNGKMKVTYLNRLDLGLNPFNLPRGQFLPIFLNSLFIGSEVAIAARLRKIQPTDEQRERAWDVSSLDYFSILLISKCARVDPARLLANHGFEQLERVGTPAILTDMFSAQEKASLNTGSASSFDTQLLILLVKQTWMERPTPDQEASIGVERILISSTVTMPPMSGVCAMRNLNRAR